MIIDPAFQIVLSTISGPINFLFGVLVIPARVSLFGEAAVSARTPIWNDSILVVLRIILLLRSGKAIGEQQQQKPFNKQFK